MVIRDEVGCETKVSFLPQSLTTEEQHVNGVNHKLPDQALQRTEDTSCGYGPCRPAFAQRFRTIAWFTVACGATSLVTSTLNGYINSQITSLEKHFNINSSTSGFLLSCNDLGFLVTTLVFSYYTRRLHIPRSLAYTTFLFGAAGLLCIVAFLGTRDQIPSPPKESQDVTEDSNAHLIQMCSNLSSPSIDICQETSTTNRTSFQISDTWKQLAIFILALSMILQGMAKAPRTPFTTTYIDDNIPRTQTAKYLGIITAVGYLGMSVSFVLGGVFSSMYVTLEETSISQRDPRWIGAWWIGFLLFGSLGIVAGIPLLFFPKRLRPQNNLKVVIETRKEKLKTRTRIFRDVTDFLRSLRRILTNPVFMCMIIGSGVNLMAIAGIATFMPKYLETQFSISASRANMALGISNTFSLSLGLILGGCLISRLKFSPRSCLKVLIGCLVMNVAIVSLGFVLGCKQPVIHTGVEIDSPSHGLQNLSHCVHTCNCDSQDFFPVCGGDGRNYFSPCHAGCTSMDQMGFSNCSCLATSESTIATGGFCAPDCNTFYPYMVMIFCKATFACFGAVPAFIVTMRSVEEVHKPISIGVNTLVNSLLGWFPAPMVFGSMIDTTCLSWKKSCTSVGACSLYDIELFRFRFHMLVIGLICITIILYSTALTIATCSKREVFQPNADEYCITIREAREQLTLHES